MPIAARDGGASRVWASKESPESSSNSDLYFAHALVNCLSRGRFACKILLQTLRMGTHMIKTIVSIEDETEIAELLSVVLDSPTLDVALVDTAFDGLSLIRETRPDLVILDVMLPDMDGWSVYDAIRADPTLRHTPIIMLTVLRREFTPRRTHNDGPLDAYITKPFDPIHLREQIEKMLGIAVWA